MMLNVDGAYLIPTVFSFLAVKTNRTARERGVVATGAARLMYSTATWLNLELRFFRLMIRVWVWVWVVYDL
ncbi:hypothetical protein Hanom_Chr01g00073921 [Helianthus anomalus]